MTNIMLKLSTNNNGFLVKIVQGVLVITTKCMFLVNISKALYMCTVTKQNSNTSREMMSKLYVIRHIHFEIKIKTFPLKNSKIEPFIS